MHSSFSPKTGNCCGCFSLNALLLVAQNWGLTPQTPSVPASHLHWMPSPWGNNYTSQLFVGPCVCCSMPFGTLPEMRWRQLSASASEASFSTRLPGQCQNYLTSLQCLPSYRQVAGCTQIISLGMMHLYSGSHSCDICSWLVRLQCMLSSRDTTLNKNATEFSVFV